MAFDLDRWLADRRPRVEQALERLIGPAPEADPLALAAAVRHALLGGGKRLRPAVVLAAAEAAGEPGAPEPIGAACALELVHAWSLVHDDLPCMDDAATRRGRPSVHRAFGEAAAVLAGDALLCAAFEALAAEGARAGRPAAYLAAARELAAAAGHAGLCRGQAIDLGQRAAPPRSFAEVEACSAAKTAALLSAAAAIGGRCAGADPGAVDRLRAIGADLGLAFQHADDQRDGDHVAFADRARARVEALCGRAGDGAAAFGERGAALAALVERVRGRVPPRTPGAAGALPSG